MSQVDELYELQEIELTILKNRKRLGEIKAELEQNEAVQQARAGVETAQKTLSPLQTKARNLDLEIQSALEKAKTTEENLYSGSVKNPKELQDMQQEIVSLKKRHSDLETQLLETMFAVEEAEATLGESQTALDMITAQWQTEHQSLLEEQSELENHTRHLLESRRKVMADIPADALKLYESMKPRKHNMPVARMEGSTCSVCGVSQNMSTEREVRSGRNITYCNNCGRILVAR
ncbi:MAG: hypothetical protein K8L99_17840 [Anaerolineae bacterium]|nr:hypothetical protein [Anaerolineae bacterium]